MTDGLEKHKNFYQFHGSSKVSQLDTKVKILAELEIKMTIIIGPLILTATKELELFVRILSIFSGLGVSV